MQHLIGNIWLHDPGTGEISFYERIGRNYRPVRAESEELPDRIPFEARKVIKERMTAALKSLNNRTPREVRLSNLEKALAFFPAYTEMAPADQERLKAQLSEGMPEAWDPPPAPTQGLPLQDTVEQQVERANQIKLAQLDALALKETELIRERERNLKLAEKLAELEAKVNGQTT